MTRQQSTHGFMAVDRQANPQVWVQCLDTLHQEPFYQTYKARVRTLLAPKPNQRFLELGGGTDTDARTLLQMTAARVVMLDVSQTMIREARQRGLPTALVGDGIPRSARSSQR